MEEPRAGDEKLDGRNEKVMAAGDSKVDSKVQHNGEENGDDNAQNIAGRNSPTAVIDLKELTESALMKKFEMLTVGGGTSAAKHLTEAQRHKYLFWDTQPVPKINEMVTENRAIEPPLDISDVREEPFSLPDPFCWCDVEINNVKELTELYTLLTENYVEDDDNMFRFDYSPQFLLWALKAPGWMKKWHCGVRAKANGKLIAFISAIPSVIRVYDKEIKMVEINFLCVHKKLRSKRVAPVLIREITRRVNREGIFQAAFTAGVVLPKPIATCRYWHRSLNPKKLIEVKFSHLSRKMTMQRTLKLYKLPDQPKTANLTPMKKYHIDGAYAILQCYLKKFDLSPEFTRADFEHFFMPREDVIYTYVALIRVNDLLPKIALKLKTYTKNLQNEEGKKVTDLISFYSLPSSVMHHPQYKSIRAAYSFYNVATSVTLKQLINDALILARNCGFDVFNALDLMDNKEILEDLKFGIGDGNLQYYLYNWKCPNIAPEKIGLVLQ
uniref:Glycylpeptide N-tetradecanoyltransferase n=1 Tax=Elaeophora elaphi TaxID=1147741 RepID=A0A158Q719_9BILA